MRARNIALWPYVAECEHRSMLKNHVVHSAIGAIITHKRLVSHERFVRFRRPSCVLLIYWTRLQTHTHTARNFPIKYFQTDKCLGRGPEREGKIVANDHYISFSISKPHTRRVPERKKFAQIKLKTNTHWHTLFGRADNMQLQLLRLDSLKLKEKVFISFVWLLFDWCAHCFHLHRAIYVDFIVSNVTILPHFGPHPMLSVISIGSKERETHKMPRTLKRKEKLDQKPKERECNRERERGREWGIDGWRMNSWPESAQMEIVEAKIFNLVRDEMLCFRNLPTTKFNWLFWMNGREEVLQSSSSSNSEYSVTPKLNLTCSGM